MTDPAAFAALMGLSCGLIFFLAQLVIVVSFVLQVLRFAFRLVTFPVRLVWRLI
jgi:hypothetical protein